MQSLCMGMHADGQGKPSTTVAGAHMCHPRAWPSSRYVVLELPPPKINNGAGVALACVPAGPVAEALRTAFFESFTLYAAAVDQLADQIAGGGAAGNPLAGGKPPAQGGAGGVPPGGPGAADATPPDRKLLVLLSNCAHVRSSVMPGLFTRWAARGI